MLSNVSKYKIFYLYSKIKYAFSIWRYIFFIDIFRDSMFILQCFISSLFIFVRIIIICCHGMNNTNRKKMNFDIMMMLIFFMILQTLFGLWRCMGKLFLRRGKHECLNISETHAPAALYLPSESHTFKFPLLVPTCNERNISSF